VVAFPSAAAAISLACALVVAWDGWRRPRPDKAAWAVAFAVFAVAAGAEVAGSVAGWTPLLARVYYLTGATLVVGYLALGELYLLAPRRVAAVGPGAALLVTALAAAVVLDAPIDSVRLASDGWEALDRGPALTALAIGINAGGTAILVGGVLFSAWRFWRRGILRHRMIGCLLIAVGTLTVAAGGTLTRLGHREYLYVAMAAGVAVIFAGYLEARRADPTRAAADRPAPAGPGAVATAPADGANGTGRGALVPLAAVRAARAAPEGDGDPAIAFLETRFLPLDDGALAEAGRVWSVERREADRFGRDEARRVWALRLRLSPAGQAAFDAHGVAARLQLAELYHEVLAPGVAELEAERRPAGRSG
jgi:hypothetical protein